MCRASIFYWLNVGKHPPRSLAGRQEGIGEGSGALCVQRLHVVNMTSFFWLGSMSELQACHQAPFGPSAQTGTHHVGGLVGGDSNED